MKNSLSRIFKFCFNFASLRLCGFAGIFFLTSYSQTLAPGAPGKDAQWASAGKQAVGTSNTLESKVWFTLQGGMLTEVFYPQVDTANVNVLQFVVVNPKTKKVETERDDANHQIKPLRADSLSFQQINTAKSGEWKITKAYTTDPERSTILISVFFDTDNKDLSLYLFYDPSLNNSGMHDTAWNDGETLFAQEKNIASALAIRSAPFGKGIDEPILQISNGFYQTSDGFEQLNRGGNITAAYSRAENGNVTQIFEISTPRTQRGSKGGKSGKYSQLFSVALGFGKTPDEARQSMTESLDKGFNKCLAEYEKGWADYVKPLPRVEPKYQAQFNMAAMVLRAFEDKTYRGGNVASLSVPWAGGVNGNETTTGYHLVWSRDLYQVATAYMALGDKASAMRALEYLFKYQQRDDGSFPQISWLDGRAVGDSIQMDEVSYPLILAYQLGKTDRAAYEKNIKRSADYIAKNGPFTKQERWEEEAGYSPSTIAAEIAGLVCAAEIAKMNGDHETAKRWLAVADDWQQSVEKWTATTTGKYGDGNHYLRLSQNGKPDSGERLELGNGAGTFDERDIIDAGFLELVRFGVKPADDPLIVKSLEVVDQILMVKTPHGESFYRYNHDGYGDTYDGRRWNWDATWRGNGHLWALLSGERGQFEIALNMELREIAMTRSGRRVSAKTGKAVRNLKSPIPNPQLRLDAMLAFSNEGLMIPEQIWDKPEIPKNFDLGFIPPTLKFGEGNGSATPLAWSMAQFIRLAINLKAGRNLETPDVVYNRYVKKLKQL
ncbi:MAG TPA: glycoside hydrolase family 15 protein [Pyrinomonadaceae bacterium]|jgi:glucoamylase